MTTENAGFCANCGAAITAGNAFCTGCGTPIPASAPVVAVPPSAPPVATPPSAPPAAAPVYAPPSSSEQILSILGGITIASGFMGLKRTSYTMIMTSTRVILAELTQDMLKSAIEDARSDTKAEGGGFFKQWGAQLAASFSYAERYWEMAPDAALAETPGNIAWDRNAIEKIKLKAGMTRDEAADDPDYITVKTGGNKFKLLMGAGSFSHAKKALIAAGLI